MDDDDAQAFLDAVVDRTAAALKAMADVDISPGEALWKLVGTYMSTANNFSPIDMAASYAIALHQLVADRQRITELEDQVAMLQALDEIREL